MTLRHALFRLKLRFSIWLERKDHDLWFFVFYVLPHPLKNIVVRPLLRIGPLNPSWPLIRAVALRKLKSLCR